MSVIKGIIKAYLGFCAVCAVAGVLFGIFGVGAKHAVNVSNAIDGFRSHVEYRGD